MSTAHHIYTHQNAALVARIVLVTFGVIKSYPNVVQFLLEAAVANMARIMVAEHEVEDVAASAYHDWHMS